jgi:hypothetical protein
MPRIVVGTIYHDDDLVTALMVSMTNKYQPNLFPGKKIAILKDKSLILVPSCAQVGDTVWTFCPGPGHWVLRRIQPENHSQLSGDLLTRFQRVRESLDAKLPLDPDSSNYDWSATWEGHANEPHYSIRQAINDVLLGTGPVEHANFIGECFPSPFAFNSFASEFMRGSSPVRQGKPKCNAQIVALH